MLEAGGRKSEREEGYVMSGGSVDGGSGVRRPTGVQVWFIYAPSRELPVTNRRTAVGGWGVVITAFKLPAS